MPDVISLQPADVRMFVALDVHKLSIVAATPAGGRPEIHRIETTEKAIRRFIAKLGGPSGLAVCDEAGPGGFAGRITLVSGSCSRAARAAARTAGARPR
jgi:hypothetical protein